MPAAKKEEVNSAPASVNVIAEATKRKHEFHKMIMDEPKEEVAVSPLYKPYFGSVMTICINGVSVYLPCDGRPYKLPKSYAREAQARIRLVDDDNIKKSRLANASMNFERAPGELRLY